MARPSPGVRLRLALISGAAVAVAIAGVSGLTYATVDRLLNQQVDEALSFPVEAPFRGTAPEGVSPPQDVIVPRDVCRLLEQSVLPRSASSIQAQWVGRDGQTCASGTFGLVTPTPEEAAGTPVTGALRNTRTDQGVPVRVRAVQAADSGTLLVVRDVSDVQSSLRRLGVVLILVTLLGSLAALVAGWLVARTSLRPLDDLTRAAERIARTEDLDVRIPVSGKDEIARTATAFNHMTSALSASRARQQQLVADAAHELRTPLTSLRTNIELLARSEATGRPLPADQRGALLGSVVSQTDELTNLVAELTVLAHDEPAGERVPVDLVAVVEKAVRRAALRGGHEIVTDLRPWTLTGDPASLERAVVNVLDNAVKFSPAGSAIRVSLRAGVLDVDDAGPGIAPADRERVFDRFWRSDSARPLPGSGLGLAIVADVAATHGGTVEALESPSGGTRLRISLPGAAAAP